MNKEKIKIKIKKEKIMNQPTQPTGQKPRYSHNATIPEAISATLSKKATFVGLLAILILAFVVSFDASATQPKNHAVVTYDMPSKAKHFKSKTVVIAERASNTKQPQTVNKAASTVNRQTKTANQDTQKIVAAQLKATFKQTTFTNLEPSPINGWYQAEISNQVIYFNPTQALMFFGELYTKTGVSLSQQTRRRWQSKRVASLDISDALVIGNGVLEIIEFTDTDCPFCQRFNQWITTKNKDYKQKYGQDLLTRKVILTPIDSLHPNAHKEAVHILCQPVDKRKDAISQSLNAKIAFENMHNCPKGRDGLLKHRAIAKEFGVSATPTLVIAGQIIQGFNQPRLEVIIKEQLNKMDAKSN